MWSTLLIDQSLCSLNPLPQIVLVQPDCQAQLGLVDNCTKAKFLLMLDRHIACYEQT